MVNKGWKGESQRHALASRGIKTGISGTTVTRITRKRDKYDARREWIASRPWLVQHQESIVDTAMANYFSELPSDWWDNHFMSDYDYSVHSDVIDDGEKAQLRSVFDFPKLSDNEVKHIKKHIESMSDDRQGNVFISKNGGIVVYDEITKDVL